MIKKKCKWALIYLSARIFFMNINLHQTRPLVGFVYMYIKIIYILDSVMKIN